MTLRRKFRQSIAVACLAAILLFAAPIAATTVVALIDRWHHRVVIAADSLLLYKLAGNRTQTCKIVAKPGCTFGMAGLFYKEYPVFHLQELAEQACSVPGDLRQKADAFMDLAKDPAMEVAQYLRGSEPDFYGELTNSNGGELIMVVFAGPEAGSASIFARGYRLGTDGGLVPVSMDVSEANNGAGFFGGSNAQIASYLKTHPHWQDKDTVKAARQFVQMEIKARPDWVGPPVSVMTVNRLDQQKWANAGVCSVAPGQQGKKKKR